MLWLDQRHALKAFRASVRDEKGHIVGALMNWRLLIRGTKTDLSNSKEKYESSLPWKRMTQ